MLRSSLRLFFRYWFPLLFYAGVILFLSSQPLSHLPRLYLPDKVLHFGEYTVLGSLLFRLFIRDLQLKGRKLWMTHFSVGALFAFSDEFLQSFIPTRQASIWDWSADMAGIAMGILLYMACRRVWEIRKGNSVDQ